MENLVLFILGAGFLLMVLVWIGAEHLAERLLSSVLVVQDYGTGYRIWLDEKSKLE